MRVQICEPRPIPEGWTYIRCDEYTLAQFKTMYTDSNGNLNPLCAEYIKNNPKKIYTTNDRIAIHEIDRERRITAIPRHTTKRYAFRDSGADNR